MRNAHWPLKLDAAIEAARKKPFAWGEHDCCLWAANVVRDLVGVDFAAEYRGRYSDPRGALEQLAAHGGMETIATGALGDPIPAKMAQRGDVVLVTSEGRPALAICAGATAAAPGQDALVFVPMAQWVKAWRV